MDSDRYHCLKTRAGLYGPGLPDGASLSKEERFFVGLDVSTSAGQDGWAPLTAHFRSQERQATLDAARLAGIRALIDVGSEEHEL